MCGFVGLLSDQAIGNKELKSQITKMADTLEHRGPDDAGDWVEGISGMALGFRRLSIIELSSAGHQPMASNSGRFIIAFNGEIYNHLELRTELLAAKAAPVWRGYSDTETLLAGFEHWGIEVTLAKTVGMFAIALWDTSNRKLYLARDRFGEKPLYYGWVGSGSEQTFAFGSELKALRTFDGFVNPVCREALAQYVRFKYVPAPRSIYQGIYKLEPGCVLCIEGSAPKTAPTRPLRPSEIYESLKLERWWSLAAIVQAGAKQKINSEDEALEALEQQLEDAVRLQKLADVPVGAFLSGGVDSSTIAALMQKQSVCPVKTFTVGFQESGFDESPFARAVAKHLGTDHTELLVTAVEAQQVIPQLSTIYDEPFSDESQIPTYLVCRAAHQEMKVTLSGDAGDELFGGYNRYFWGPQIWAKLAWLPYSLRQVLGATIKAIPIAGWDALSLPINALLTDGRGIARAGDKAHKLASRLRSVHSFDDLYLSLVSQWQDPAHVVRGEKGSSVIEPNSLLDDPLPEGDLNDFSNSPLKMMYRDSMTYLPDDILCKVDRAAMATSLETRLPFLDHRVAELAWRMPKNTKIRDGKGKWALRQLLYKYVPCDLIDRPKAGFGIPIGQWLRGPLRPWAENLLDQNRLNSEGYFYSRPIRKRWAEHLTGARDHSESLWVVLMFQAWLEQQ